MSQEQIDIAVLKEQISENKKDIGSVDAKVEKIMTNHLPHIQAAINDNFIETTKRFSNLESKIAFYAGGISVAIPVLTWVINKYL